MDICSEKLSSKCSQNFLGVNIDNKLIFEEHVELCKKASQKLSAVARISSLMRFKQRKRIVNLFITSHFSHCSLVLMFHSWRLNNHSIDHIHERASRIIYQDYNSSFKELLRNIFYSNDKSKVILHFQRSYWQKQPPEMFYKKRCSEKFRKSHMKTPLLVFLF